MSLGQGTREEAQQSRDCDPMSCHKSRYEQKKMATYSNTLEYSSFLTDNI